MNEAVKKDIEEKHEVRSLEDKSTIERNVPVSLAETLGLKINKDETLNVEFGFKKYEGNEEYYVIDVRKQLPKFVAISLLEQLINLYPEEAFDIIKREKNEL